MINLCIWQWFLCELLNIKYTYVVHAKIAVRLEEKPSLLEIKVWLFFGIVFGLKGEKRKASCQSKTPGPGMMEDELFLLRLIDLSS